MKTAGIIIFTFDLLKIFYKSFTNVTQKDVVDFEEFETAKDNQHTIGWQPYVGIGMIFIGAALLRLGNRKSLTA
jgi:hypothetical protein